MEDKETEIIFLQKQIEELKKELELLKGRENEKRASLMINAIPDMVFRLDKNGVYLDYKADVTDLYAQSVENIIGKKIGKGKPLFHKKAQLSMDFTC